MVYYLKIADVGIKINCPNNLYMFDDWQIFFEQKWGKPYLVDRIYPNIRIELTGMKLRGLKVINNKITKIENPKIVDNRILFFDNRLNNGLLLGLLKIMVKKVLDGRGLILMHASGVVVNNRAILVMGDSGSGKTTTLKKLMKYYQPVAEDEVVVNIEDNKIMVISVMFSNKIDNNLMMSKKCELGAILTIKKNQTLKVSKMSEFRALSFLIGQSKSLMNNKTKAKWILRLAKLMSDKVYVLGCNKNDDINVMIKKLIV